MTDILDLVVADDGGQQVVENHALDHVPCSGQQSTLDHVPCSGQQSGEENQFKPVLLQGKCGQGRHGSKIEREFLTYHMRSTKDLRKNTKHWVPSLKAWKVQLFRRMEKVFGFQRKATPRKVRGSYFPCQRRAEEGIGLYERFIFQSFLKQRFRPAPAMLLLLGDWVFIPVLFQNCRRRALGYASPLSQSFFCICWRAAERSVLLQCSGH